ncbi:pyroglutamyl-peptidase 1 isoform X2 [Planococcus citri]
MHLEEECNVRLITEEIPVTYDDVDTIVPQLWNKYQPLLMVHAGVSHIAKCLTLESCANKSGYCKSDAKECILLNGINSFGNEEHLKTKLDLNNISSEASQFSVNLCISDDASRYLCEYIYYTSLNINTCNTIFVHVPMINAEYSASKIAEHLKLIIKLALKQLREL